MAPQLRQRGSAAGRRAQQQQQQQPEQAPELTAAQRANFYFAQHVGLACCAAGVGLLAAGYDRGWVPNSQLCLVALLLCLLGLFFHELRPFNAQQIYEEDAKEKAAAAAAAAAAAGAS